MYGLSSFDPLGGARVAKEPEQHAVLAAYAAQRTPPFGQSSFDPLGGARMAEEPEPGCCVSARYASAVGQSSFVPLGTGRSIPGSIAPTWA